MKKNTLQKINDAFNDAFTEPVFMPMVTFTVVLMLVLVMLDYSFQLIEAIDILTQ